MLFCVQYLDTTFILGSKIVYYPQRGRQLEGYCGLPTTEKEKILDVGNALEWHHIAGLLEGNHDLSL